MLPRVWWFTMAKLCCLCSAKPDKWKAFSMSTHSSCPLFIFVVLWSYCATSILKNNTQYLDLKLQFSCAQIKIAWNCEHYTLYNHVLLNFWQKICNFFWIFQFLLKSHPYFCQWMYGQDLRANAPDPNQGHYLRRQKNLGVRKIDLLTVQKHLMLYSLVCTR